MNVLNEMCKLFRDAKWDVRTFESADISATKRVSNDVYVYALVSSTGMLCSYKYQQLPSGRRKVISLYENFDMTESSDLNKLEEFWSK